MGVMLENEFELLLDQLCTTLSAEALQQPFTSSKQFEDRVRQEIGVLVDGTGERVDFDPQPQAFPDIGVGRLGIEVKFTSNDTWRSVANSVSERSRLSDVEKIYIVFGKMGGTPGVRWAEYEKCVMHVRTSHVPRFEVEVHPIPDKSLFDRMNIPYEKFRRSDMEDKMHYVRDYARSRLGKGERLWWLEDRAEPEHTLPIQARLYTSLPTAEKTRLRAEAVLLCPSIVGSGRNRNKYDDVVLYLLTYRGVLCHQARDLFSAGSVANPENDDLGGVYIERAIRLIQDEIREAAQRLDDALFEEYWGERVPKNKRIARWLQKADSIAKDWRPSESLFRGT